MAKKSKIAKNKKRQETVEKYRAIREEMKKNKDYEGLKKLPRDASPTRVVNRCEITVRPHGVSRQFGISRIKFRELAHKGQIPGVKKASW